MSNRQLHTYVRTRERERARHVGYRWRARTPREERLVKPDTGGDHRERGCGQRKDPSTEPGAGQCLIGQEVEIQPKRRLRRRGRWSEQRIERTVFWKPNFLKTTSRSRKESEVYVVKRLWKMILVTKDAQDKKGHRWRIQRLSSQCHPLWFPEQPFLLLTGTHTGLLLPGSLHRREKGLCL